MARRPEQVIAGYHARDAQMRERTQALTRGIWETAGSWRDRDVDRLVERIVPIVEGAKVAVAGNTAAYAQAMAAAVDDRDVPMFLLGADELRQVRGVDPEVVYRRPAVQMYRALGDGRPVREALSMGLARLASIVSSDLQLAKTHQQRLSWAGGGYTYTVRTLTGREDCALCILAATQRYTVDELQPMHPGCDCGSRQISSRHDPGHVLDEGLVESVHAEIEGHLGAAERTGRAVEVGEERIDYRDLVVVQQHGELGPVLAWRGQTFTGPDDI